MSSFGEEIPIIQTSELDAEGEPLQSVLFLKLELANEVAEPTTLRLGRRDGSNRLNNLPEIDFYVVFGAGAKSISGEQLSIHLNKKNTFVISKDAKNPTWLVRDNRPPVKATIGTLLDGDIFLIAEVQITVQLVDTHELPEGKNHKLTLLTSDLTDDISEEVKEQPTLLPDDSGFGIEEALDSRGVVTTGSSSVGVNSWEVTPELLMRIQDLVEDIEVREQRMRSATPLYEEERGVFVRFEDDGSGLRPVYRTPSGIEFFVSPYYDSSCEKSQIIEE